MRQVRLLPQNENKKTVGLSGAQSSPDALSSNLPHLETGWPLSPHPEPTSASQEAQPTSLTEKNTPPVTPVNTSSPGVSRSVPGTTKSGGRVFVIPASHKRPKKVPTTEKASARHLSSRLRQTILIAAILVIFSGTLTTLLPLATGQSGFTFFSNPSTLINFLQNSLHIQAHQTQVASTNMPPPMTLSHSEYVAIAQQDAIDAGIPPDYFVRQIQLESGFNPNAVSPSGALGIAQFMPATAAGLGIDPMDPIQALKGAAKMMANLYHQYGDYAKALAAYNAGSANLNNAIQSCGSNWLSCMPAQTQNYVATIMG